MTGLRLLVVDDDRDSTDEMVELLECHGYVAKAAHDLASARRALAGFDPDWALVDVRLGDENGLDLAQEWARRPRPRVVLVSGLEAPSDVGTPSLLKPIDLARLERILRA